jgi:hypothetical protein
LISTLGGRKEEIMAAIKSLYMDVVEGRITIQDAAVMLSSQNPDVEYTPDQVQVLELMAQENEQLRNFDQMDEDADMEHLAQLDNDERIAELGLITDL